MSDIATIRKDIREIKNRLESTELPVSEKEAAEWLGISIKTLQNRVYEKSVAGAYIINILGQRMYYKSKLLSK